MALALVLPSLVLPVLPVLPGSISGYVCWLGINMSNWLLTGYDRNNPNPDHEIAGLDAWADSIGHVCSAWLVLGLYLLLYNPILPALAGPYTITIKTLTMNLPG